MIAAVPLKGGGWTDAPTPVFRLPADTPIAEVTRHAALAVRDALPPPS